MQLGLYGWRYVVRNAPAAATSQDGHVTDSWEVIEQSATKMVPGDHWGIGHTDQCSDSLGAPPSCSSQSTRQPASLN